MGNFDGNHSVIFEQEQCMKLFGCKVERLHDQSPADN